MRQMIRKAVLVAYPSLQHVIEERDRLKLHVQAAQSTQGTQKISHRLYSSLNLDPVIGKGSSVDDSRIVNRLLKSYQRSSSDQYGTNSD